MTSGVCLFWEGSRTGISAPHEQTAGESPALLSFSGFDAASGVGALPGVVGGGAVAGWNAVSELAKVSGELGAMVRGVKQASPEDPDALALDVEEGTNFEPPLLFARGETGEARCAEFFVPFRKRERGWLGRE